MSYPINLQVTAFDAERNIASGPLGDVVIDVERYRVRAPQAQIAVFDDATGECLALDWSLPAAGGPGSFGAPVPGLASEPEQPAQAGPRKPGRPRLGVVAREVTLLPKHWVWLARQEGGASAALRRLVDEAHLAEATRERKRRAHEAAYRYMTLVGQQLPGYEEALQTLPAGDPVQFEAQLMTWPEDMRDYAKRLAFPQLVS